MDTAHPPTEARLSPTLRATFESLAKDQGVRGAITPRAAFPAPLLAPLPQVPWLLSDRTVARTRGQCFLTVWVTTPSGPATGLIGRIRNYPSLFLLSPCSLANTYFRAARIPAQPSWDRAFSQLLNTN